jgi:hypothetical protein
MRFLFLLFVAFMLFRWIGFARWRRVRRREFQERTSGLSEIENRLSLIERLEARVDELEQRLDFTERLLEGRRGG